MQRRAALDGLRAIAVVLVILFHAGFPGFDGGFVGVDIFFVLSGYLITTLIHEELQSGSFSLLGFYERRVRRILPALVFVALACIPFAWLWMLPQDLAAFSRSLVGVGAFSSNLFFWLQSGYFAKPAATMPLLHTWSLAVEEQFYLFYPLALLACRQLSRGKLSNLILLGSALSLGLAAFTSQRYPLASFYLLPTRAWELGTGAWVALAHEQADDSHHLVQNLAAFGALIAIACSVVFFDPNLPYPGFIALLPVMGTALLIASGTPQTIVGRIFASPLLSGIGLISYSAYLWHQPLFAFARIYLPHVPALAYAFLSVLTFGLAYLSWRFVEQPFRDKARFGRLQVFSLAACCTAVILALGLAGQLSQGFPQRMPEVAAMAEWVWDRHARRDECTPEAQNPIVHGRSCLYGASTRPQIALIGDSHAVSVAARFSEELSRYGISLRALTEISCPPIVGIRSDALACELHNTEVQRYLLENSQIETVILVARWTAHLEGENFDNEEGGIEGGPTIHNVPVGMNHEFLSRPAHVQVLVSLFRDSINALLQGGKRVVLVYPVPEVGWDVPRQIVQRARFTIGRREPITTSYDVFKKRNGPTYTELDLLGESPKLLRVYPADLFCNSQVPDRCVAELDGRPLYFDDDHLNYSVGAKMLAAQIVGAMKNRGWINSSQAQSQTVYSSSR